jgi:hypothetical protein
MMSSIRQINYLSKTHAFKIKHIKVSVHKVILFNVHRLLEDQKNGEVMNTEVR